MWVWFGVGEETLRLVEIGRKGFFLLKKGGFGKHGAPFKKASLHVVYINHSHSSTKTLAQKSGKQFFFVRFEMLYRELGREKFAPRGKYLAGGGGDEQKCT